jgi:phage terminase large subunit-like protein
MGLRGPGAKPLTSRREALEALTSRSCPWDALGLTRADRVIAFVEDLTVSAGKAANQKLRLRPWQRKFLKAVYREDKRGVRPVRTAVLSMARKNGKSQLAAALALCHLCGPEAESRGEVYSCANDRFQSGRIFNEMVALINRHAALSARTNVTSFRKEIHDLVNGSIYVALTAEAKTKLGLSPSFVIYDELGSADNRALFDAMDSAMGGRENPLMLVISTQAADDFAPMSQLVDYGLQLEAGDIRDPAFHLTLYSAAEDADPWSKKAWRAANPALGDFRSLADVERMAKQAQHMPARENAFRNLILNQRVAAEARFMDQAAWRACSGEPTCAPRRRGTTTRRVVRSVAPCRPSGGSWPAPARRLATWQYPRAPGPRPATLVWFGRWGGGCVLHASDPTKRAHWRLLVQADRAALARFDAWDGVYVSAVHHRS